MIHRGNYCFCSLLFSSSTLYLTASMTGWVNRFANAGDTAMEVAGNTALRVRNKVHNTRSYGVV